MKKLLFLFLGLLVTGNLFAQSPKVSAESANASVTYGQPSKKGREIFGKLVPYGKVWRTGANEATEITIKKTVKIGSAIVKPGTYSLFTIPTEGEWTIILNSSLKQWGSYDYDKIKANDVANFKIASKSLDTVVEKLTIDINDQNLNISWDKTMVSIPLVYDIKLD